MKITKRKLAALAALMFYGFKLALTRPTVAITQWTDCASSQCTHDGGTKQCLASNKCSFSSGCWLGSTDACCPASLRKPQVNKCDFKAYRLKQAIGYNIDSGTGYNFSAAELIFSPIDIASGLADLTYMLGSTKGQVSTKRQTITFVNEIVGIKLVWSSSPDFDGILFLETDGTIQRIGLDKAYIPVKADFTLLQGRFIGFTGKFTSDKDDSQPTKNIIEIGIIIDLTICEEGVFTSPNPFADIEVDLETGTTYTQTHLIDLTTPWKSCSFSTPTFSPSPIWLTSSYNSSTKMLTTNVQSTDLSLTGSTVTISVVLNADMKNSDTSSPKDPGYSFQVTFKSSHCVVTSLGVTPIPDTNYRLNQQGPKQTIAFVFTQTPSCGFSYTLSYLSTPDASSLTSFDQMNSKFSIDITNNKYIGTYAFAVTITLNQPIGATLTKRFPFNLTVYQIDPCINTYFLDSSWQKAAVNMTAYVEQGPVSQAFTAIDFQQQISGDPFFCGSRIFTISPDTYPFLTLTSNMLTLQSSDPNDVVYGTIEITITATLVDYKQITPMNQKFYIEIICVVESLDWSLEPALPSTYFHHLVTDPSAYIPFEVIQIPLCGASLKYSLILTPNTTPEWAQIGFGEGNYAEIIAANDLSQAGKPHSFTIEAIERLSSQTISWKTDVILVHPCDVTVLDFDQEVENMVAYVGQGANTQRVSASDTSGSNLENSLLCGEQTFTMSPTKSCLSIDTNILTLQSYDPKDVTNGQLPITITATLVDYPSISPVSQTFFIEIICPVDPCFCTTISAVPVPLQTFYVWEALTLTLSMPFTGFVADVVAATNGVDCGTFAYTVTSTKMIPSSLDSLNYLLIDQSKINIELDASKIGADGLTAEFNLFGKLASFPPFHTETFTVKVYSYECTAQAQTFIYKVGSNEMSILFTIKQAPDTELNPEIIPFIVKNSAGPKVEKLGFITLTKTSIGHQFTLSISSTNNSDIGFYTVGFEAVFEGGKATKSCSVDLEIVAQELYTFFPTRFFDSKAKDMIEFEEDSNGFQILKTISVSPLKGWSGTLPSILGEADGQKFVIKVDLGALANVLVYETHSRKFYLAPGSEDVQEGTYLIQITILNRYAKSTIFDLPIIITGWEGKIGVIPGKNEAKLIQATSLEDIRRQIFFDRGVRISSVSFDGKVFLTFTNEIIVPNNFTGLLNVRNKTEVYSVVSLSKMRRELLDDPRWYIDKEMQQDIFLELKMLRLEQGETVRGNLTSWTVQEANSTGIEIKLTFDQPLFVSQQLERDKLLFRMNFGNFTDNHGRHLPPLLLKIKDLPPQIGSKEGTFIKNIAQAVSGCLVFFMVANFTSNAYLGASLSLVWGVLNVMQLIAHQPIYGQLIFPANVLVLNTFILTIAQLKLIDTEEYLDKHLYQVPEEDPFSQSFEDCGYDSTLLLANASNTIWMIKLHLVFMILSGGMIWLFNRKCCKGRCNNTKKSMQEYFFFNGMIRLIMESSFELAITATLNMHTVDWDTSLREVKYSTALAILSLIVLGAFTTFLTVFYWTNFSKLKQKSCRDRFGAGVAGTKVDVTIPKRSILAYPVIFFGRRIIFALSAIYLREFFWGQIFIQITIFFLVTGYQVHLKYLESPFENRLELMNECTIMLLTYGQLHFTEYMPEPDTRNSVGYLYIGVVLTNVGIHMIILIRDTCTKAKFACRRFYYTCKFKCKRLYQPKTRQCVRVQSDVAAQGREAIGQDRCETDQPLTQTATNSQQPTDFVEARTKSLGSAMSQAQRKIKLIPAPENHGQSRTRQGGVSQRQMPSKSKHRKIQIKTKAFVKETTQQIKVQKRQTLDGESMFSDYVPQSELNEPMAQETSNQLQLKQKIPLDGESLFSHKESHRQKKQLITVSDSNKNKHRSDWNNAMKSGHTIFKLVDKTTTSNLIQSHRGGIYEIEEEVKATRFVQSRGGDIYEQEEDEDCAPKIIKSLRGGLYEV